MISKLFLTIAINASYYTLLLQYARYTMSTLSCQIGHTLKCGVGWYPSLVLFESSNKNDFT